MAKSRILRGRSNEPVSAPPMPDNPPFFDPRQIRQETQNLAQLPPVSETTEEPTLLAELPVVDWEGVATDALNKSFTTFFEMGQAQPDKVYGRLSVILSARGADATVIEGMLLPYEQFIVKRAALTEIVNTPIPMRVGMIEFHVDESQTTGEIGNGNCFEVVYLTTEAIIGVSANLFEWAYNPDIQGNYLRPIRVSLRQMEK